MVDKSFAFFLKRINFTQKNEAKNIPKSQERLAVLAVKMQCLELKKKKKKTSPILAERKPPCVCQKFELQNIFREVALYYIYEIHTLDVT